MLSKELKDKMYIMRMLSDIHSVAILQELVNAKAPVLHRELSDVVLVLQHETSNMQWNIRELERIGIVEIIPDKEHIVSYRLDPGMDEFCAELIKLLFSTAKAPTLN